MCLYTHIVVGAVAGAAAPNLILAPVFGLGSHIVLDIIPHYDFEKISREIGLGILVFLLLAVGGFLDTRAALGAVFGALPDLENLFWKKGLITDEQRVFPTHSGLIPHGKEIGPRNLVLQTALVGVSLVLLART